MSVGLYVIVKDEEANLPRLLASIDGCFDEVVLVDTGSTDDTVAVFETWGRNQSDSMLWFRVARFDWIDDFGAARDYAMRQCESDWVVYADADEVIKGADQLRAIAAAQPDDVTAVCFWREYHPGHTDYLPRMTRRDHATWSGVRHEALVSDGLQVRAEGPQWVHSRAGEGRGERGGASGGEAWGYLRGDRDALYRQVSEHPDDARATFYLAQTHRDLGDTSIAINWYKKRFAMQGWAEEAYYAAFEAGRLEADLPDGDVWGLVKAWEYRPTRAEPLYELCWRCRTRGMPETAYTFAKRGAVIPASSDALFIHSYVYEWGMRFELSVAAALTGRVGEALAVGGLLLEEGNLPKNIRIQAERNYALCGGLG